MKKHPPHPTPSTPAGLKKFLKKHAEGETLAVLDAKLGNVIKEKLGINCIYSSGVMELTRGIRAQFTTLITGLTQQDLRPMSLGLSHSLSRYKLKFSPDKVDTMIVQVGGWGRLWGCRCWWGGGGDGDGWEGGLLAGGPCDGTQGPCWALEGSCWAACMAAIAAVPRTWLAGYLPPPPPPCGAGSLMRA